SPTSTATVELCEGPGPEVSSLSATPRADLVHAVDLDVELDAEAAIAARCTRADDPSEILVYTAPAAARHELALHGLAASTRYTCELVATCPASSAPVSFEFTTLAGPPGLPEVQVSTPSAVGTTGPPYLLVGHDRHCVGDTPRMLVYDLDGERRWYYDDLPDIDIAFETQYLGGGEFSFGGGFYDGAPPQQLDLDHELTYQVGSPNAQSHLFHHDGKRLPDGRWLVMMIEGVSAGPQSWDGFSVGLVDPATDTDTYFYDSQSAVDAGDLPPGYGDPWHANWADYQVDPVNGDRLYVSLCSLGEIIAIDAASAQVAWRFGAGGDFDLTYPNGAAPPADVAWPQCQHGLEFVPFAGGGGGNLLVYDNGAHGRGYSRLVEYELDETTMQATLLWTYTEPRWMEPSWGDIDALPGGHVSATMGHACWSPYESDVSSVVEVEPSTGEVAWRLDFADPTDAIYRSERVDACDVFPIVDRCPVAAANLEVLLPLFGPRG
ncbi:MAG: aryl-sulfate sulfotransferase, partial [Myxococcota bacterium]